jgi:hypothetical protein
MQQKHVRGFSTRDDDFFVPWQLKGWNQVFPPVSYTITSFRVVGSAIPPLGFDVFSVAARVWPP